MRRRQETRRLVRQRDLRGHVRASTACLHFPMRGIVESCNLAVAAGIVLHHAAELRRRASGRVA